MKNFSNTNAEEVETNSDNKLRKKLYERKKSMIKIGKKE